MTIEKWISELIIILTKITHSSRLYQIRIHNFWEIIILSQSISQPRTTTTAMILADKRQIIMTINTNTQIIRGYHNKQPEVDQARNTQRPAKSLCHMQARNLSAFQTQLIYISSLKLPSIIARDLAWARASNARFI